MPTKEQAFMELMRRGELAPAEIARFKEAARLELEKRESLEKKLPSPLPAQRTPTPLFQSEDVAAFPEATMPLPGKEEIKGVVRAGMPYIRPTLEFGGFTAGGIGGAPVGPMGSVGGAGLGYAMGSEAADLLEEWSAPKPVPLASPMEARLAPTPSRKPLPATLEEALPKAEERFATGATLEMGGQVPGKLVEIYGVPTARKLGQVVQKGIAKAIRPSVRLQRTAAQMQIYYDRAKQAVLAIIANKNSLKLKDAEGNIVSGLPKTLSQFSEAIAQTKQDIFRQYNELTKAAGKEGLAINLKPIVEELKVITENKALQDQGSVAVDHAKNMIKKLTERQTYTASEAQEAIAILNNKLNVYYRTPEYKEAGKAYVDAMIANNLRRSLDEGIASLTGAEYQELKNLYGALTHIERDVTRRAVVDARKNIKGLIDFSDMFTGYEVLAGLFRAEPSRMAAGLGARIVKARIKFINDPNRIVKNLFQDAENIIMKKTVPAKAKTAEFVGKAAGYTVEKIRETK